MVFGDIGMLRHRDIVISRYPDLVISWYLMVFDGVMSRYLKYVFAHIVMYTYLRGHGR